MAVVLVQLALWLLRTTVVVMAVVVMAVVVMAVVLHRPPLVVGAPMGTMLVAPRPHRVVMQAVRRRLGAQPHAPRFTPARLIRRTGSPRLSVLDRGMVHQRARRRQVLAG